MNHFLTFLAGMGTVFLMLAVLYWWSSRTDKDSWHD